MTTTSLTSILRVLLIEDDETDVFLVNEILKGGRTRSAVPEFEMVVAETLAAGLAALEDGPIDVILLDLMLPDSRGMDSLRKVVAKANTTPVVVLSNMNDEQLSIEAAENGAQDYLVKGHVEAMWLARIMRYAVARKAAIQSLQRQLDAFRHAPDAGAWRTALDLSADAVLLLDADGRVRHANAAAIALGDGMVGLPAAQAFFRLGVLGTDGAPLPEDRLPNRACADGELLDIPVLVKTPDNPAPRETRLKAAPVRGDDGHVNAIAVSFIVPASR